MASQRLLSVSKPCGSSPSACRGVSTSLLSSMISWNVKTTSFWRCQVVAQHIPISLLELNTFGHAVCALLIYLLWWQKPSEVDYPTIIEGGHWWEVCALLWMTDNQTPITRKVNRDFRNCVEKKKLFTEVHISHFDSLILLWVDISRTLQILGNLLLWLYFNNLANEHWLPLGRSRIGFLFVVSNEKKG